MRSGINFIQTHRSQAQWGQFHALPCILHSRFPTQSEQGRAMTRPPVSFHAAEGPQQPDLEAVEGREGQRLRPAEIVP